MGCQESKTVKVQPFSPGHNRATHPGSGRIDLTRSSTEGEIIAADGVSPQRRKRKTKSGRSRGSTDSLGYGYDGSERGHSASSKTSAKSQDSGLGLAEDYSFVITENSAPDVVREVESNFENKDIDMSVVGTACPRRQSARAKRHEELVILQALREEGLIARQTATSAGGLSFEVVVDKPEEAMRRPPARLAKLEKRKKKRKVLTEEQIQEKLARAEQRRKEREQSKLERIREWENKHDQIAGSSQSESKAMETQVQEKLDKVADKRDKQLRQIQERMRKQAEHAERVRQRKLAAALAAAREVEQTEEAGEGGEQEAAGTRTVVQVLPAEEQQS